VTRSIADRDGQGSVEAALESTTESMMVPETFVSANADRVSG